MPIKWIQITRRVWVAGFHHYRAVVIFMDDVWVARVEDHGDIFYPAQITFHGLEGAKTWAELKLQELADST